jgi:hypothetical protein
MYIYYIKNICHDHWLSKYFICLTHKTMSFWNWLHTIEKSCWLWHIYKYLEMYFYCIFFCYFFYVEQLLCIKIQRNNAENGIKWCIIIKIRITLKLKLTLKLVFMIKIIPKYWTFDTIMNRRFFCKSSKLPILRYIMSSSMFSQLINTIIIRNMGTVVSLFLKLTMHLYSCAPKIL